MFARHFLHALWFNLARGRHGDTRLSARRLGLLLWLTPAYLLLQLFHRLCFALDWLLFPGFRKVVIKQPVFIAGLPRSGTTFFHRLLAADKETFTSFRTWELLLAPAICQKKLALLIGKLDRRLGNPLRKAILRFEDRHLAVLRTMHPLGFFEAEEDEVLLVHHGSSVYLSLIFPFPGPEAHRFFDRDIPPRSQRATMAFYRACVQRHLFQFGQEKRFLSKNPPFSAKLLALREAFPDACFLYPLRQPAQVIPSAWSLLAFLYTRFCEVSDLSAYQQKVLEVLIFWMEHPLRVFANWPAWRFAVLPFEEMTRQPVAVVERLYREQLGLVLSEEYRARLVEEEQASRAYKSQHRYASQYLSEPGQAWMDRFGLAYEALASLSAGQAPAGGPAAETDRPAGRGEASS